MVQCVTLKDFPITIFFFFFFFLKLWTVRGRGQSVREQQGMGTCYLCQQSSGLTDQGQSHCPEGGEERRLGMAAGLSPECRWWDKSTGWLGSQVCGPGSSLASPRHVCSVARPRTRQGSEFIRSSWAKGKRTSFLNESARLRGSSVSESTSNTSRLVVGDRVQRWSLHSGPWHRLCYTRHWL